MYSPDLAREGTCPRTVRGAASASCANRHIGRAVAQPELRFISLVALRAHLRAPIAAWISQCGFCRLQLSPAIRPGEGHCHLSGCLQPAPQDSTGRTEDGTGLSHRSSPVRVASHPGPSSNQGGPISTVTLSMLAGPAPTRRDRILPTACLVHGFWRGGTRAQGCLG